jgi:hypothetical protein
MKHEILTFRTDKVIAGIIRKLSKEERRTVSNTIERVLIVGLKALKNGK